MTTPVDVLIIGAGASGAAVAWSLAETKMHILCLEQGDWMKPSEYPSTARDWEARQLNDFHISPNRRARDTDYPINDADSPPPLCVDPRGWRTGHAVPVRGLFSGTSRNKLGLTPGGEGLVSTLLDEQITVTICRIKIIKKNGYLL